MHDRHSFLFLGALLSLGACQDPSAGEADLASAPADLATAVVAQKVTIRDLNTNKVPAGTLVAFSGVLTSPVAYVEVAGMTSCELTMLVGQPDPAPTLHDGIQVVYEKSAVDPGDMALGSARCRAATMDEPITKLTMGHAVDVIGSLAVSSSGERTIVLSTEANIVDKGDAPSKPLPVVLDPKALVNGTAMPFLDAAGALVQFQTVTVSDINKYQDFNVSTDGMNKATIASNFMRSTTPMYMAPATGSVLMSVTGIVFIDFGGTVWARTAADIVPKMP